MVDDLHTLYYLGYYTRVAKESPNLKKDDQDLEYMVLRSRLALGQLRFVEESCKPQANATQKGVYLLAQSLSATSTDQIDQLLSRRDDSLLRVSPHYAMCLAIIQLSLDRPSQALELLNGVAHPEAAALRIEALLAIARVDLAEIELSTISNDVLQKLNRGFIAFYKDSDAIQLALNDFMDLNDTFRSYGTSLLLANAIAVCHFALGQWESGFTAITPVREQFPNDETTAINLAVATAHTAKRFEEIRTQIEVVKALQRNRYRVKIDEMLEDFNQTAERLQSG
jgi:hypothetical protein